MPTPDADPTGRSNAGIHRLARVTVLATFVLIVAGGLVTSTGSGLAVPDWPLSNGQLMPEMKGGVFFEHGHRMIAGAVALLTLALAIWILRREERKKVKVLGMMALFAVLAQATLGGLTVLLGLPPAISIGHAALAQTFFCLMVGLVVVTSPVWRVRTDRRPEGGGVRVLSLAATGAVFTQLLLGAVLRHTGSGVTPHLLGAGILFVLGTVLALRVMDRHSDERRLVFPAMMIILLLVVQVALGIVALVAAASVWAPTAHVAFGALILATCLHLTIWSHRLLAPRTSSRPAAVRMQGVSA